MTSVISLGGGTIRGGWTFRLTPTGDEPTRLNTRGASYDQAMAEADADANATRRVLAGSREAFSEIVDRHQGRVFGLCLRMLGVQEDAQDATQDAFILAFTRLRSFDPSYKFKTWLMTIASNHCIDLIRRRRNMAMNFADLASDGDAEPAERLPAPDPAPELVHEQNSRRQAVFDMLGELDAEDRAMLVMLYWADMSYEDIARARNSTVSAVKSRLFRARRAMAASKRAANVVEVLA